MAYNNFYDLDVWKEARRFKNLVYEIVKGFPSAERYDLSSQLVRAARSIPANLAEGHGRQTVKDELRFCIMARGSWTECLNHLIDAKDCGLLTFENLGELKADWDKLGRLLNGYINFQRSQMSRTTPNTEAVDPDSEPSEQHLSESKTDYGSTITDPDNLQDVDNTSFIKLLRG